MKSLRKAAYAECNEIQMLCCHTFISVLMATKVQIIFEIADVSPIIFSQKHHPDEKKRKPLTSVSLFSSLGNWHPYPGASDHLLFGMNIGILRAHARIHKVFYPCNRCHLATLSENQRVTCDNEVTRVTTNDDFDAKRG